MIQRIRARPQDFVAEHWPELSVAPHWQNGRLESGAIALRAFLCRDGDGYALDGVKWFVPFAHVADVLLVAARTTPSADAREGITLFVVEGRPPGLAVTPTAGRPRSTIQVPNPRITLRTSSSPFATLAGGSLVSAWCLPVRR